MRSLVAFSLLTLLAAGSGPADDPKDSGLVEDVEVSLIQRTLLAFDRDGLPVTDLRPEEIVVEDRGDPHAVAFLDRRDAPPDENPVTARVMLDLPGGPAAPVESAPGEPRCYVILLDLVNRPMFGADEIQDQLQRFVGTSFRPEELVSVLSYSGELEMELPFTNDVSKLEQAIESAYARKVLPGMDPGRRVRALVRRLQACRNQDPEGVASCVDQIAGSYEAEASSAARRFLTFLRGGVRYASGLDGRKAVVVVSQGGPLTADLEARAAIAAVFGTTYTGLSDQADAFVVDSLVREAGMADVALHFVSVPFAGGSDFGAASSVGPPAAANVEPLAIAYRSAVQGMTVLAKETGGRHVEATSVESAMKQAVDLERGGYTLGYYVDGRPKPGKFRRVKIRCTRPGVEIVTARGYALPIPDDRQITMTVSLLGFEPVGDDLYRVPFLIQADPREIGYKLRRGEAVANFTVETALRRPDGRTVVKTFNFLNHAIPKKLWKDPDLEPIDLEGFVEVPAGEFVLSVVLRNPKNGKSGRVSQPVRLVLQRPTSNRR